MLKRFLVATFAMAASAAFADVTTSADLLGPEDGGTQPPVGVIAIDVLVDADADDVWTAGGLRGDVTAAGQALGVALRYGPGDDPNTPRSEQLFNPGTGNRFVTFLTKPRVRDGAGRYTNAGAGIAGRYSPTGALEEATATTINAAWFANPPEGPNSPSADGAVARVSLDVANVIALPDFQGFVVGLPSAATGPIIFQSSTDDGPNTGSVSASFDNPTISGVDWAVWYTVVPEPASLALIALGGPAAFRRR